MVWRTLQHTPNGKSFPDVLTNFLCAPHSAAASQLAVTYTLSVRLNVCVVFPTEILQQL